MMCRIIPPTGGKEAFGTPTHMPSEPRAGEFRMLISVQVSVSMSIGDTVKPHAPTRGSRQGSWGAVPRPRSRSVTSAATCGPTETKKRLSSSLDSWGSTGAPLRFPPTTSRRLRHTECGSRSLMRASILSRVSRRMADRTARFRSRYSAELRPSARRAARRRDMRSPVAAETVGPVGLRTRTDRNGACLSSTGVKVDIKISHFSETVGELKTPPQSAQYRS